MLISILQKVVIAVSIIVFLVVLFRNFNRINISIAIYLIICMAGLITLNWGMHKIIKEGSSLGIGLILISVPVIILTLIKLLQTLKS